MKKYLRSYEMSQNLNPKKFDDLILLKMSAKFEDNGEVTISAKTPLSSVELTTTEEIAMQVYQQLGARFLETIESELEELKGDMES